MFLHLKKHLFYTLHDLNKTNTLEIIMFSVPITMFLIFLKQMHAINQGLPTLFLMIFSLLVPIFAILILSKIYREKVESTVKNIDDNFIILKNKKLLESRIKNRTDKNLKDNKNKFL